MLLDLDIFLEASLDPSVRRKRQPSLSGVEMCCVQQWDSIEIEEETDDNRIVKSNIRVPMQVSRDVSHRVSR